MTAALPVLQYLSAASSAFNVAWLNGLTPEQQARMLQLLGTRTAMGCGAVAKIKVAPPEATGFDALLRDGARIRHAWVGAAIEQLLCCGNSMNEDTERGNTLTAESLAQLAAQAEKLITEYGATVSKNRQLIDSALGIALSAAEGWLVSADGLSPLLLAPLSLNAGGVDGLGPQSWKLGTAVRVRRLRNPQPLTAAEASTRFAGLISQQGSIASVEEIEITGLPGLRHDLMPAFVSWKASVTVVVEGDFTYFIETGCPSNVVDACSAIESAATSLQIVS